MSGSLFSNISGFNNIAVQNIKESEKISSEMKNENDFTSNKAETLLFNYAPFENDIVI